jgi:hypothetical protein
MRRRALEAEERNYILGAQHFLGVLLSKAYFFWHTYWRCVVAHINTHIFSAVLEHAVP